MKIKFGAMALILTFILLTGCNKDKCIECTIGTKKESYCEPDQETLDMQKDQIVAKGGSCKNI
jgi:hypothetical protein